MLNNSQLISQMMMNNNDSSTFSLESPSGTKKESKSNKSAPDSAKDKVKAREQANKTSPTDKSNESASERDGQSESKEEKFRKFEGEGVQFKAKLIGSELVMEPRGDKICQDSIKRLKAIIRGQKTHKRRIILKISYEGVKVLDEKTNEVIHHNEVPQISFIASDDLDSRTFGYICDVPSKAHRFICFKTSGPAVQVMSVISTLFEAVLERKTRREAAGTQPEQPQTAPEQAAEVAAAPTLLGEPLAEIPTECTEPQAPAPAPQPTSQPQPQPKMAREQSSEFLQFGYLDFDGFVQELARPPTLPPAPLSQQPLHQLHHQHSAPLPSWQSPQRPYQQSLLLQQSPPQQSPPQHSPLHQSPLHQSPPAAQSQSKTFRELHGLASIKKSASSDQTDKYAVFNNIDNLPSIFESASSLGPPIPDRNRNHISSGGGLDSLIVGSAPMGSLHRPPVQSPLEPLLNQSPTKSQMAQAHARFSSSMMAGGLREKPSSSIGTLKSTGSASGLSRLNNPFDDDFFA